MDFEQKVYFEADQSVEVPVYGSVDAAGCDVKVAEDCVILPGQTVIVKTGFKLALPKGTELQVRPRSGLSLKTDLRIPNSPGTIDADYRHECGIIMQNSFQQSHLIDRLIADSDLINKLNGEYKLVKLSDYLLERGTAAELLEVLPEYLRNSEVYIDQQGNPYGTVYLKKGERIAQLVLNSFHKIDFVAHDDVSSIGSDRGGGYGSTGRF